MNDLTKNNAIQDRDEEIIVSSFHYVNKNEIKKNYDKNFSEIFLGLGCFWGAERLFWSIPEVYVTSVGYGGGFTKNPTYQDLCSGQTGHAELVRVIFKPSEKFLLHILKVFWQSHDPTQGMRQGNDIGTQYRSCIYTTNEEQLKIAKKTRDTYQKNLNDNGINNIITTDIRPNDTFYFAENYHQQYLAKNPNGYCGIQGIGIPIDI